MLRLSLIFDNWPTFLFCTIVSHKENYIPVSSNSILSFFQVPYSNMTENVMLLTLKIGDSYFLS